MKWFFIAIVFVPIVASPVLAATRYYFPSTGEVVTITPTFDSTWAVTTEADRRWCHTYRTSTSLESEKAASNTAATQNILNRQYISDALLAPTVIKGNVRGQLRCLESSPSSNAFTCVVIKVVSSTGAYRATILPSWAGANEFNSTSYTNRYIPSVTALTTYTAEAGDRIVFEIGVSKQGATGQPREDREMFGDNSASDLLADELDTTASNPWIEFDQDIVVPGKSSVTIVD